MGGLTLLLNSTQQVHGAQLTRGPYIQLQEPESIRIVWLTDTSCTGEVEWGLTTGYGTVTQTGGAGTQHEVDITGLSPDMLYHYQVRCGGVHLSGDATFRSAPPSNSTSVSFTFVGDTAGSPGNATANYNAMLPEVANGFCITMGDLAGRGEDNLTDYWKLHYFDPAAAFIRHVNVYTCIGNHEIYDEDSFPGYVYPTQYLQNFSMPTANSGTELYYSFDKANVHFACVDTFWSSYTTGSAQHTWLAAHVPRNPRNGCRCPDRRGRRRERSARMGRSHLAPRRRAAGTVDRQRIRRMANDHIRSAERGCAGVHR